MKVISAVRGMNDILPDDAMYWQQLYDACQAICASYTYRRIQLPIVEKTDLFARTIGDATDVVEKEMYTFDDRNGDSLSLRPEGTAGCVRAAIEHGLCFRQIQRLWYWGPMFRHERPQRGRYRQFTQWGVETFGLTGPAVDAELIAMNAALWAQLGLQDHIHLQINSLGSPDCRKAYRVALVDYLQSHAAGLDEDSKRRLTRNPLRVLDSKNPAMADIIAKAPVLADYLSDEARAHHVHLCQQLDSMGIAYTENPHLVRGLDYYNLTVFEWVTESLGAQGTLSAGGRYDGLVAQLGGHAAPAAGFALGVERVVELLKDQAAGAQATTVDIYVILSAAALADAAPGLLNQWRQAMPGLRLQVDLTGAAIKKQFKRADQSGAEWALVMDDEGLAAQTVQLKALRRDMAPVVITWDTCVDQLSDYI